MTGVDPAVHAAVVQFGGSALAWEVLRRDASYRAAYARLASPPQAGVAASSDFVADWGLHFR